MGEMGYCVEFAKASRAWMLENILVAMEKVVKIGYHHFIDGANIPDASIDIAHNYAAWENHFGENVIIHRKGATRARAGEIGIIPGDMKSKSYIVIGVGGKENRDSFHSCSHGAGRAMSRTAANKMISTEEAEASMEGIIHGPFTKTNIRTGLVSKDTSEAHGSYKDIGEVMEQQKGLFDIMHTLSPIINIKG